VKASPHAVHSRFGITLSYAALLALIGFFAWGGTAVAAVHTISYSIVVDPPIVVCDGDPADQKGGAGPSYGSGTARAANQEFIATIVILVREPGEAGGQDCIGCGIHRGATAKALRPWNPASGCNPSTEDRNFNRPLPTSLLISHLVSSSPVDMM